NRPTLSALKYMIAASISPEVGCLPDHFIQSRWSHENQARNAFVIKKFAKVVQSIQNILAENLRQSPDKNLLLIRPDASQIGDESIATLYCHDPHWKAPRYSFYYPISIRRRGYCTEDEISLPLRDLQLCEQEIDLIQIL